MKKTVNNGTSYLSKIWAFTIFWGAILGGISHSFFHYDHNELSSFLFGVLILIFGGGFIGTPFFFLLALVSDYLFQMPISEIKLRLLINVIFIVFGILPIWFFFHDSFVGNGISLFTPYIFVLSFGV